MKSTQQKSTKKKLSPLFWILIIVSPIVLLVGIDLIYNYVNNTQTQREDKIKSEKIETFVNQIKSRLDNEVPEGKWVITDYCTEARVKGEHLGYTCFYYVESNKNISNKTLVNEIFNNSVESTSEPYYDKLNKYTSYRGEVENGIECSLTISDKRDDTSIGCATNPLAPTYELVN